MEAAPHTLQIYQSKLCQDCLQQNLKGLEIPSNWNERFLSNLKLLISWYISTRTHYENILDNFLNKCLKYILRILTEELKIESDWLILCGKNNRSAVRSWSSVSVRPRQRRDYELLKTLKSDKLEGELKILCRIKSWIDWVKFDSHDSLLFSKL